MLQTTPRNKINNTQQKEQKKAPVTVCNNFFKKKINLIVLPLLLTDQCMLRFGPRFFKVLCRPLITARRSVASLALDVQPSFTAIQLPGTNKPSRVSECVERNCHRCCGCNVSKNWKWLSCFFFFGVCLSLWLVCLGCLVSSCLAAWQLQMCKLALTASMGKQHSKKIMPTQQLVCFVWNCRTPTKQLVIESVLRFSPILLLWAV